MYDDERTVPVDEYMRDGLGWRDVVNEESFDDDLDEFGVRFHNPVNEFCDGPYQQIGGGCYRRLPCAGSDDVTW